MKNFLQEYGFSVLAAIVVVLLIVMASPVGNTIKENLQNVTTTFGDKAEDFVNKLDTGASFGESLDSETLAEIQSLKDNLSANEELAIYYANGGTFTDGSTVFWYIWNLDLDETTSCSNWDIYNGVWDTGSNDWWYPTSVTKDGCYNIGVSNVSDRLASYDEIDEWCYNHEAGDHIWEYYVIWVSTDHSGQLYVMYNNLYDEYESAFLYVEGDTLILSDWLNSYNTDDFVTLLTNSRQEDIWQTVNGSNDSLTYEGGVLVYDGNKYVDYDGCGRFDFIPVNWPIYNTSTGRWVFDEFELRWFDHWTIGPK